jgi:hypothetical protein
MIKIKERINDNKVFIERIFEATVKMLSMIWTRPEFIKLIVEFLPQAEKTLPMLTHANLNPNSVYGYMDGWIAMMNKIG